jgi:hypothetical protein
MLLRQRRASSVSGAAEGQRDQVKTDLKNLAMGSPVTRPTVTAQMPGHGRSKVTNGKRLFADMTVDGRSGWYRRLRDLINLHVADLGGENVVSAGEYSICRRIGTITVELELLERKFAL